MPGKDDQNFVTSSYMSEPSTPMSGVSKTPTKQETSGAALYAAYMANPDAYHRRLRKSPNPKSSDAAGLLSTSKHFTRSPITKGQATIVEQGTGTFTPSKHFVPGRSFVSVTDLLKHHEEPPAPSPNRTLTGGSSALRHSIADFRPCMKLTDRSFNSSFSRVGVAIPEESTKAKPMRKAGSNANNKDTAARVMLAGPIPASESLDATPSKWHHHYDVAQKMTRDMEAAKAASAPPKRMTEARKYYHADLQGSNDVFQYRHSGGICPDEYKFQSSDRPRRPATAQPLATQPQHDRPASARESFMDATRGYSYNRVRSYVSNITY